MLLRVFPDCSFYPLTGNTVVVEDPKVFESGKTIEQFAINYEAISEGREETSGSTNDNEGSDELLVEILAFPSTVCSDGARNLGQGERLKDKIGNKKLI